MCPRVDEHGGQDPQQGQQEGGGRARLRSIGEQHAQLHSRRQKYCRDDQSGQPAHGEPARPADPHPGVFGFAVGFNTPLRFAVAAACIGSVANTARLTLIGWHLPQQFAAAGATFVVGVAAAVVSRHIRSPRIVLSVPAVLIMIPGAAAFRALVFLNDGQITLALANGVQAVLIVASLATGLVIARVVTDRGWTLD
jgi:uncharacterized membrane protein YjjB (DUF3815 family)